MEGELLWFNEVRQDGLIRADGGEQLVVFGSAFPQGRGPVGRCAGTRVAFDVVTDAGTPQAVGVTYVPATSARRARTRSRR